MENKVLLMILDGWGQTQNPDVSAIAQANTPFIDSCYERFPHAELNTSGTAVGLPEGQMGNSEVGHMNIGAGRVVYQNLERINRAVRDGSLAKQEELVKAFEYAAHNNVNLHFIGLVSDGGVHSHINHLKGLLHAAYDFGLKNVFVHAFTDGRDCDPKSGAGFITDIQHYMTQTTGQLASVTGRYFAMDRDRRWERVKVAYDAMVLGMGIQTHDAVAEIEKSYAEEITDEFLQPIICLNENGEPMAKIKDRDVVIFINFRTDRPRQITEALVINNFPELNMHTLDLYFVTMTAYDEDFKKIHVIYNEESLRDTMGEVLEKFGKNQIRIAETEKYPHVTFFFSGGREEPFVGESRILCPSPKDVATYDLKPEMSAYDLRDNIIPALQKREADFICLNFANADMVGHTGVFDAAVKACETVDICAKDVTEAAVANGYSVAIIADHGNSDIMLNADGTPNTQHTTNPVPFFFITPENNARIKNGKLGDLAPSFLKWMGIEIPESMTGEIIIEKI
ncbi:MAG: 2,3-bisphosphoglycerate-independent phosphoglycerate mutase [Flavobacteriaceae bacterium]|nr:2,3-bisphosphoglycerate-independent phosphoglycerate mutase [Flavobacteriaceae bacterium]